MSTGLSSAAASQANTSAIAGTHRPVLATYSLVFRCEKAGPWKRVLRRVQHRSLSRVSGGRFHGLGMLAPAFRVLRGLVSDSGRSECSEQG